MPATHIPRVGIQGDFRQASDVPARKWRRGQPCFSLRLYQAERKRLEQDAGETPLATYIKFRLFNHVPGITKAGRISKHAPPEVRMIDKLLAALGKASWPIASTNSPRRRTWTSSRSRQTRKSSSRRLSL